MPITIAHQPPAWAIAEPAFAAGMGQFRQQQFQNGMAVMQLALAERARQQDMAMRQQAMALDNQQYQQSLAAQQASQLMHARLQQQQYANQQAMNDADNQAAWQRSQFEASQRSQNYADLRDHQSQMQQTKIASSMSEANKQERLKRLAGVVANANPQGQNIATQLRNDLGVLSSRFAMGELDPQTYESALQEWDSRFQAEGDWQQYAVDPAARFKSEFEASLFTHPQYGPGRFAKRKDGATIFIPESPKSEMRDGMLWTGVPDPENGLWKWGPAQQPKPPAPPKPPKREFQMKDVQERAREIADADRTKTPQQAFEMALQELRQQQAMMGEGEAAPAQQVQQPDQSVPQNPNVQAAVDAAARDLRQQQADPTIMPQSIQEGTPEAGVWKFIDEVARAKPETSDLVNQIKVRLASRRKANDEMVVPLIQELHRKIQQDAARKGLAP